MGSGTINLFSFCTPGCPVRGCTEVGQNTCAQPHYFFGAPGAPLSAIYDLELPAQLGDPAKVIHRRRIEAERELRVTLAGNAAA